MLTAAQLPSHVRGKPLLQLEASAQQTLFSWFVMALRTERGSAGRLCEGDAGARRDVFPALDQEGSSQQRILALLGGRVHLRMEHRQRRKRHRK